MFRIGIVGAGGMGNAHAKALEEIENAQVAAVAEPDEERRSKFASDYACRGYADFRDMLDADVDAVWVCTPPFLHKEPVIAAAQAGKHVFCEKPLTINLEAADEMLEEVEKAGVKLSVGYVLYFFPHHRAFIDRLAAGDLGDLVSCWVDRVGYWGPAEEGWLGDPAKSGGMLIECMTHEIDWLMRIGGEATSVYGKSDVIGDVKIDRNVWAIVNFKDAYGVLGASWAARAGHSGRGVIGAEGSMSSDGANITIALNDGTSEKLSFDRDSSHVQREDEEFLDCIANDKEPVNTGERARKNLEICLAIHKSSKEGRVIELG